MATGYTITDQLPKDSGGAKFAALVNPSALDFVVQMAIGASTVASRILGRAGIATHEQASLIEAKGALVAIGGIHLPYAATQTSPVGVGQANVARMNNWGALFVEGYPKTASLILGAGSRDAIKSTSGVVFSVNIAWADASGTFALKNNLANVAGFSLPTASGNYSACVPVGGWAFGTSIVLDKAVGGAGGGTASVTISYL